MSSTEHDLIVVGGGSGGIGAARVARFRDVSVAIVQDGPLGGDCTWTGCVPSKALLAAAAAGTSFDEAMATVQSAVQTIAGHETAEALAEEGIDVIAGRGVLTGPREVTVDGVVHRARIAVIVSPGSAPLLPPIDGLDQVGALTNEEIWSLPSLPARLAIIGGGPIGMEMAQAFTRMGSSVTVVEGASRVMPRDDADAAAVVHRVLSAEGVDIRTGVFASSVRREDAGTVHLELADGTVHLELADGSVVEADQLLVAAGRRPAHASMGLEEVGVKMTDRGWIEVDEHLQTAVDGVYAIGDAVGDRQFTHAAGHMAWLAVENALARGMRRFSKHSYDPGNIPWVTFTSPEVAQVGVTEAEAADIDGAVVAELPLAELDRAVAVGRTDGFVKLISVPRRGLGMTGGGRLIGATIVADRAGELAGEAALAVRTGMFAGRLAQTVHAYPTWSIALQMAAAQLVGEYGGRTARPPRRDA